MLGLPANDDAHRINNDHLPSNKSKIMLLGDLITGFHYTGQVYEDTMSEATNYDSMT